jgi:hypothetical protein
MNKHCGILYRGQIKKLSKTVKGRKRLLNSGIKPIKRRKIRRNRK